MSDPAETAKPGAMPRRLRLPEDDAIVAPDERERTAEPDELAAAWRSWVQHGPQGPIDDEDPAFP